MRLVLARLLWAFDVCLSDAKDQWDWGKQNTYVLWVRDPVQDARHYAPCLPR